MEICMFVTETKLRHVQSTDVSRFHRHNFTTRSKKKKPVLQDWPALGLVGGRWIGLDLASAENLFFSQCHIVRVQRQIDKNPDDSYWRGGVEVVFFFLHLYMLTKLRVKRTFVMVSVGTQSQDQPTPRGNSIIGLSSPPRGWPNPKVSGASFLAGGGSVFLHRQGTHCCNCTSD